MDTVVRPSLYFGWPLVGLVFLAHFMSIGTGLYAMNAFMQPLCELRTWTRTELNVALVAGTVAGLSGQFIYGLLLPHVQIRWLMASGAITAGVAFMAAMRVTELWQFYLFYTLLFIGNGAYGGIVANTLINNWFIKGRGKAMGLATSGVSLAGAVIPLVAMGLIATHGIQAAADLIGGGILLLAPLAWWLVRDWPEDCGLRPDGQRLSGDRATIPDKSRVDEAVSVLNASKHTAAFWKLGIAFGLLITGTVGVMSQLKPRFVDIGFADSQAISLLILTALAATAGKWVWGWLCDFIPPRRVASVMALANAIGLGIALLGSHHLIVLTFSIIFGFAMGGIMALYPILAASLFGRRSFPRVYRLLSLFLILQIAGYIIAGQSYDRFGSYEIAYASFMILDCIAALLLSSLPS